MQHDQIFADWQENARPHHAANYTFLEGLAKQDDDASIDAMARQLHQDAFQRVDCTRCANCCKTLQVRFNPEDIERVADHLAITKKSLIEEYLEPLEGTDLHKARVKPCPFLDDNNRCSIYEVRPAVCESYPHTDREPLAENPLKVANNARACPAAFWIVEQMRVRAGA